MDPNSKRHLIKKLDDEYRASQVALNRAESALNYVRRLKENKYKRERIKLINGHDDDLHA
jgi:hypothetical protein